MKLVLITMFRIKFSDIEAAEEAAAVAPTASITEARPGSI